MLTNDEQTALRRLLERLRSAINEQVGNVAVEMPALEAGELIPVIERLVNAGADSSIQLRCWRCGKSVSTPVPADTVVRACIECPECAANEAPAPVNAELCVWKQDEWHGYYDTACGEAFEHENGGTPEQNHFCHCPGCGKTIKVERKENEENHNQ